MDKFKKAGKWIADKQKERAEFIKERKQLLSKLTMPDLKKIQKDYDIQITWLFEEKPSRPDYINSLARSRLQTEIIEKYVKKMERREERELAVPKSNKIIHQHFHDKAEFRFGDKSSFVGDININEIENIINDFSVSVVKSNINSELKVKSIEKIEELKKEFANPNPDETKIGKIFEWFKNNKSELTQLAIPFINEILDNIR